MSWKDIEMSRPIRMKDERKYVQTISRSCDECARYSQ